MSPCGKAVICASSICTCDATHCFWEPNGALGGSSFDMQVTATTMDGAVSGIDLNRNPVNVHFDRGS
jgi:hypothetical protein